MGKIKLLLGWIFARWILGVRYKRLDENHARMTGPRRAKGMLDEAVRRTKEDAWREGKEAKLKIVGNTTTLIVDGKVLEIQYR